ncbi:protein-methionine-sulfoxide reductase catalytic subunit MsrP [Eilatimonas milleporae]|uniref:Protein-methionine-sulfoxide reductase catalytic subunit MsrP n=1 Tax=Eilatimonas milleporae TaxID=911205 RepID=A0A3M0CS30_9PROT|nr:protein-methionine-sulfoxide reductase catalytic subunit MsrP [Eilatimonas milleporae]RMB12332.1 sulfoxide reductase catalytic subunit YedY [Eilatimonas milleporae]
MRIRHRRPWDEREAAVTPEPVYLNRRRFLMAAGALTGVGAVGLAVQSAPQDRILQPLPHAKTSFDPGGELTPEEAITSYNNYYEFGVDKSDPSRNAWRLQPKPWSVAVDGMVERPAAYAFEDLVDFSALEERIYRLRCVEAWSMVVPWIGVPLASLLDKVGVQTGAKYVRFETLADEKQMPGLKWPVVDWPYVEGLRLDEATNPLALIAVGLYGKELPNQNGAPLRLVVPWKYGFKSIKSIVRITLTDVRPRTTWERQNAREYGFFANVNPDVPHPRWSQATERRIGEFGRRRTEKFNGYGELVAHLYQGMDLRQYY